MAIKSLEMVPPEQQDWHPGSDEKVLDLVHPSLYPLMYGTSRIIPEGSISLDNCLTPPRSANGKVAAVILPPASKPEPPKIRFDYLAKRTELMHAWSTQYQWLPCDVALDKFENSVR